MHSSFDRDDYVTINWDNIVDDRKSEFVKYESNQVSHFGSSYDLISLMHYPSTAFSKNKQPTILPKVMHSSEIDDEIAF